MSENIINKARENSVNRERKIVAKRRKKMINYVTLLLLIVSILANIALAKKIDFSNPHTFDKVTYGKDNDKEFEDVNNIMESCISSCIRAKIKKDTHRVKDANGIDQNKFYYNFTNYDDIFSNLEVTLNTYKMNYNDAQEFSNFINNLSDEEKQAILIYYGTPLIDYDNAKEKFKEHVGKDLIEKGATAQTVEALAENAVHKLTGNYLDNYWINNSLGRSNH